MSHHVVIGAGPTGTGVATLLAGQGERVVVLTRRGQGPEGPGIERVAGDATDADEVARLARGAATLFNCANPAYNRWPTDWPPIASALLRAAEATGAALVTLSNLYAYGPPAGPMTPHDPLSATYAKAKVRAAMWRDALAAHEAGRARAVEVRASDFIGPGVEGHLGARVVPRLLAGKPCRVLGDPDAPHSWSFVDDVVRTLVACARDASTHGRAWHVPSTTRSPRQAITEMAAIAGVAPVKVSAVPRLALRVGGLFSPMLRELPDVLYQFERPFVLDDHETRERLHLEPTPWDEVLRANLAPFSLAARSGGGTTGRHGRTGSARHPAP